MVKRDWWGRFRRAPNQLKLYLTIYYGQHAIVDKLYSPWGQNLSEGGEGMGGVDTMAEAGHLHTLLELDLLQENHHHHQSHIYHSRLLCDCDVLLMFYHDVSLCFLFLECHYEGVSWTVSLLRTDCDWSAAVVTGDCSVLCTLHTAWLYSRSSLGDLLSGIVMCTCCTSTIRTFNTRDYKHQNAPNFVYTENINNLSKAPPHRLYSTENLPV